MFIIFAKAMSSKRARMSEELDRTVAQTGHGLSSVPRI